MAWFENAVKFGVGFGCGISAHLPASRAVAKSVVGWQGIVAYRKGDMSVPGLHAFALGIDLGFWTWIIVRHLFWGIRRGNRYVGSIKGMQRAWGYHALHVCSVRTAPIKLSFCPTCAHCNGNVCWGCAQLLGDSFWHPICRCRYVAAQWKA